MRYSNTPLSHPAINGSSDILVSLVVQITKTSSIKLFPFDSNKSPTLSTAQQNAQTTLNLEYTAMSERIELSFRDIMLRKNKTVAKVRKLVSSFLHSWNYHLM